ncbi:MAG: glycosyltransferase 87 family protein [Parvularculaceae bacterium]
MTARTFDMTAPRTASLLLAGAIVLFAAGIAPLIFFEHPRTGPVDFHHLWTAGKMWASGGSPYSLSRAALFADHGLPHVYAAPAPFFYPPHAIVLFGPFGFLSPGAASIAFALLSAAALAAASVLAADILRAAGATGSRLALASGHAIILIAGWNATAVIFFHNIATIDVYLALLAVLRGVQTRNGALIAAGSFFALMAPQISIGLVFALLLLRRARGAIVTGLAAVAVFSLAGLAPGGVSASLATFLDNLAAYSTYPANTPLTQSGAGFFAAAIFDQRFGTGILLACCAAAVAVFNLFGLRPGEREADRSIEFLILAIVAGMFFLPSLNHYYVVLTPALFVIVFKRGRWRMLAVPAALALMRSLDIVLAHQTIAPLHRGNYSGLLDSISILMLFLAFAWHWTSGRPLPPGIASAWRSLRRTIAAQAVARFTPQPPI